MHSLYAVAPGNKRGRELLNKTEKFSVYYHDIFDYPLTFADLIKWNTSENFPSEITDKPINCRDGYYFLKGREGLVYKRSFRERTSAKKMEIAKKASKILSLIPSIKMVAVTGSLAMKNSVDESDIDLFIVTGKNFLWTTRLVSYLLLKICNFKLRKFGNKNQKDMLCLNLWIDESDLIWGKKDRNIYTAHEIAQILPLVNKDGTYEKFLRENVWILKFWPNAVKIVNSNLKIVNSRARETFLEKIAYKIQFNHMKSEISRETVTKTRAVFHPQDWGKMVLSRFGLD